MVPKCIGSACYFLILTSILVLILSLAASQEIYLLFFSELNALGLETQVLLSLINSILTVICAISILNGNIMGRQVWHIWAVIYFFINAWQLQDRIYLVPAAIILLLVMFLLYGKSAQVFFSDRRSTRPLSRRVDDTFNIFDED